MVFVVIWMLALCPAESVRVVPRRAPVIRLASLIDGHNGESSGRAETLLDGACRRHDPGRGGDVRPKKAPFALRAVSANTTSWGTAKEFLLYTDAHVVLVQEHKLKEDDIPAASESADYHGWSAVWQPATVGSRGGSSAGEAIFARRGIGLRKAAVDTLFPSRFVAGIIEAPGCPPMCVVSAYFRPDIGMTDLSVTLLAEVIAHCELSGVPGFVGADFNSDPSAVRATGALERIDGTLFVADGTCTAGSVATTIDYFMVFGGLENGVASVDTLRGTCVKTHRPVVLTFHENLTSLRMLKLRKPPLIPIAPTACTRWARMFQALCFRADSGNEAARQVPKARPWQSQADIANRALASALAGHKQLALHLLDSAYGTFADEAEREFLDVTGADIPVLGLRGRVPKSVWAPRV